MAKDDRRRQGAATTAALVLVLRVRNRGVVVVVGAPHAESSGIVVGSERSRALSLSFPLSFGGGGRV
jgi:hypothetical protein